MSDIAINPVTRRVQFTGNTGTGPYAFTFNILVSGDIAVFKGTTELTLTTDYSVSINANGTGSITLVAALIASDVLTIIGGRELSRTTDFVTAGDLLASSLNEQLDSNVIMTQQLDEKLNRGLYVNPGDVYTDLELPLKDARKGTVLGFNATTGDPEPGPEIADVDSLAAISADIKTLAEIQDGTVATDAITNVNTIRANVTTVSGVSGNVTTVAGISGNVTSVAGNATNINTVAGIDSNVTTVAGISGNVTTVAGNTTNINSVAGNSTNINTVAGDATEINAVAGKATEIGRLGTADAVSDLNTLGTADVVSDMNTLGTSGNVNNMGTLAGISGNITTVAGISANVTTVAGDTANISSVAGNSTNINTVAGQTTNLQNVTDNLAAIQSAPANATAAAGSASAAAGSATAASDSAAAAAGAFDSFDDKYLGSKTGYAGSGTGPTTDNDGNALVEGALFFSADANEMRVYDGANWIAASSAGTASLILYEFTATSGQTTFSGADDNGATLGYTTGNTQFVLNGVILDPSDVTATNGTSAVLASGAATGDLLNVYAFKSFTVADTVSASAGGTFAGNVAFGANATFGDNDKAIFGAGSDLQIYHAGSASYIDDVGTGSLNIRGTNLFLRDSSDNLMAGGIAGAEFRLYHNNSQKLATTSTGIDVTGTVTADGLTVQNANDVTTNTAEFRNDNGNRTFRFAQNTAGDADLLLEKNDGTDAVLISTHGNSYFNGGNVGIGTSSPAKTLDVAGQIRGIDRYYFKRPSDSYSLSVLSRWDGSTGSPLTGTVGINTAIGSEEAGGSVIIAPANVERMRISSSGNVLIGKTTESATTAGWQFKQSGEAIVGRVANDDIFVFQNSSTGGTVGRISITSSSTSYNTSSDYRLKTDAQPMTGASARVQALNPVNFEWIADGSRVDGFLAHEAATVVPESVTGTKDAMQDEEYEVTAAIEATYDDDGTELTAAVDAVMGTRSVPDYQGIDQSKLVPLLTAALQEALTEITDLKARVIALEAV